MGGRGAGVCGRAVLLGLALGLLAAAPMGKGAGPLPGEDAERGFERYRQVIEKTAGMVGDPDVQRKAQKHGLDVLNLTWEDTARWKDSAVGPNISDMTIQVQQKHPKTGQVVLTCMPVIRFPNFGDRTADVRPEKFHLLAGNHKGRSLRPVHLRELLGNPRLYLSRPGSWRGDHTYLLADRDSHVLVSAQACFLPVPKKGLAEFTPVLFNYQSTPGDPAVLAILATREGTSMTVIDNQRDTFPAGGSWGQRLFHNKKGERAVFTGQRLSDFTAAQKKKEPLVEPPTPHPKVKLAKESGLNMVLLIQVPLKQRERPPEDGFPNGSMDKTATDKASKDKKADPKSDVEAAVIGHGKVEGPFTEMADLPVERDPRFPVRVTVQFYKATSNGVVSGKDMAEIAAQIERVYKEGDHVGSLVTQGRTGRPTEHAEHEVRDPRAWAAFWREQEERTGYGRAEVVAELRKANGPKWYPVTEFALAREAEGLNLPPLSEVGRAWRRHGGYLLAGTVLAALLGSALYLRQRYRRASAG